MSYLEEEDAGDGDNEDDLAHARETVENKDDDDDGGGGGDYF